MRQVPMILGLAAMVSMVLGCAAVPVFPDNESHALTSSDEFGVLVAQPDTYKGRAIRLAGRMVSVESTDEGTMIVAEWLPFPEPWQYGPVPARGTETRRFTLFYPGFLDPMGTWQGNKFVVAGAVKGMKELVTLEGLSKSVPHIEARCLRVWKTGTSEFSSDAPDIEQAGFPPLRQTYCIDS